MCVYVIAAFARGLPSRSRILPETLPPCGIISTNKAIAVNELIMVAPIGTRVPSLFGFMTPQKKPKFHDSREFPLLEKGRFDGDKAAGRLESWAKGRPHEARFAG